VFVKKNGLDLIWDPHTDYRNARGVADWVCDQWGTPGTRIAGVAKVSDPQDAIEFALDEVRGTCNYHWAWTPEQLTRAALMAFVDNGGEI